MNKIILKRCNRTPINLYFKQKSGQPYNITVGHTLALTVKKSASDDDADIVLQKVFTGDGGNHYEIEFSEEETDLKVGTYKYDIKDVDLKKTLIRPLDFIISEVVFEGDEVENE